MDLRIEEIVSTYIDDLNAGTAQPIDIFLCQFSDLTDIEIAGIRLTLQTLAILGRPSPDKQVRNIDQSILFIHALQRDSVTDEFPTQAASVTAPTIGGFLSETLLNNPESFQRFRLPQETMQRLLQDDSPLEPLMQENPEQRIRFAQHHASQDQSLRSRIGSLVAYLSRVWHKGSIRNSANPLVFTRPAPKDPERN